MKHTVLSLAFLFVCMLRVLAQEVKAEETEDWTSNTKEIEPVRNGRPPSDAVVLFADRQDVVKWECIDSTAVKWDLVGNTMRAVKKAKSIQTKQKFGSIQLHLEWQTPDSAEDRSNSRGNSGILFMGLYELQMYESYHSTHKMYYNGIAGSIYKQYAPLVNATLPPQQWQTYDVVFEAPQFGTDKTLKAPAYITVFLNGVLVQNHVAVKGPMIYAGYPKYTWHEARLPLMLQEHDSRVSFRNIWVREL